MLYWCLTDIWAFYTGLGLVILGVGLLKPNISTMVGGLYKEGDIRRDKGFSIFYIGINLGSLLATMIVGGVVAKWGWHAGFGLAGIVMVLGLIITYSGQKYLLELVILYQVLTIKMKCLTVNYILNYLVLQAINVCWCIISCISIWLVYYGMGLWSIIYVFNSNISFINDDL